MNKIKYKEMIDAILKSWGYPSIEWKELEGKTLQDDAFISAALVVYQGL